MGHGVSSILLAAGSSKRMGRIKQLLPLGNKPAIRHCLESIIATGVKEVVAVIGPEGHEIAEALQGLPVTVVINEEHESEMAESVRTALRALGKSSSAVLVCLCDHPLVSTSTMELLIAAHREDTHRIIVPLFEGKRGHPSLFPRTVIEEIFSGINLREILRKDTDRVKYIAVVDEGVILDMDTAEDYHRIYEKQRHQGTDR